MDTPLYADYPVRVGASNLGNPVHLDLVENIASMPPHALVLNPQIEDDEFAKMLNASPHNGYFAQSRGSVFVRMALLAAIVGG